MRTWNKPLAVVAPFIANEYVAACWGVACDVMDKLPNGGTKGSVGYDEFQKNETHRKAFCGQDSHQQVMFDEHRRAISMDEVDTDGLGTLSCTITNMAISDVNPGDYITWTTSHNGRTWTHHGTVTANVYNHS